jgi:hypothetical protein
MKLKWLYVIGGLVIFSVVMFALITVKLDSFLEDDEVDPAAQKHLRSNNEHFRVKNL